MFSFIGQTGPASRSSSFGDSETVNNNTDGSIDDGLISPTGWGLIGTNGNLELCVIGPSGCGIADHASQTIIGGRAGDVYSSANGSIIGSGRGGGNNGHTPFLVGPVTFVIDIPGLTSRSTISGVSFSFGTTADNDIMGVCTPGSASCVTTTRLRRNPHRSSCWVQAWGRSA